MAEFINTVDVVGDKVLTASIIDKSITEYKDNSVIKIGRSAFQQCSNLTSVDCPIATSIEENAFYLCSKLVSVNFPAATSIFASFKNCSKLVSLDLPAATSIGTSSFSSCSRLIALILRSNTVCKLSKADALNNTPINSGTGYIYVPAAIVDSYKAATNWSAYATLFRALEDYTVDGTTTGELDPTKI